MLTTVCSSGPKMCIGFCKKSSHSFGCELGSCDDVLCINFRVKRKLDTREGILSVQLFLFFLTPL